MKLSAYLAAKGLTITTASKETGLSKGNLSKLARGLVKPSWETMELIAKWSKYEVMPNDWADFAPPKRRRKAA